MKDVRRALYALPGIGHADFWLVASVAGMVGALVLPLPALLLDALLALNLATAGLVLASVLLAERVLALSTFPSVLLLCTLFRLVLNVSTTRMILTEGRAGDLVIAFGRFVVGGQVVVGLVVFGVITLIQFLVIAKGAERVAEVGARFTLDAMPGKQMSIDAAIRAGTLNETLAQTKRDELHLEAQFYGSMDGAMKFVKGDAIAGLLITGLNLLAGLFVGISQLGLTVVEAVQTFCLLTVGDGLVSQIPALLVALAAGLLTTRVSGHDRSGLGGQIERELLSSPKSLGAAAGFSIALGLLPGLPIVPFAAIALLLAALGWRQQFLRQRPPPPIADVSETALVSTSPEPTPAPEMVNVVHPVAIDLDPVLSRALDFDAAARHGSELLDELIPELRQVVFSELGVRVPSVRICTDVVSMAAGQFVIRVKDVPVAEGLVDPDRLLVTVSAESLQSVGVEASAIPHPWGLGLAALVPKSSEPTVEGLGHTVWTPAGQVALHLARVLRQRAAAFVGLQETAEMLETLEQTYPSVVREAVPKVVTIPQLTDILRRLVDERVSIRDLRSVLEALVERSDGTTDPVTRTEIVRVGLGAQIAHAHAGLGRQLPAVLLEPALEDLLLDAVVHQPAGSYLAVEPQQQRVLVGAIARTMTPAFAAGERPVLLTRSEIRRYLRKLVEPDLPEVAVLSFEELPSHLMVQPLGRVVLPDDVHRAA